jgi:hypothetical protein
VVKNDQIMNGIIGELTKNIIDEIKNEDKELNIFEIAKSVSKKSRLNFSNDQMQNVSQKMNNFHKFDLEKIYEFGNNSSLLLFDKDNDNDKDKDKDKDNDNDNDNNNNYKNFSQSIIQLIDLINNKSIETMDNLIFLYACGEISESLFNKKQEHNNKLQKVCGIIKNGFTNENNEFDKEKIIKKIYETITKNINLLYPEPNISLFKLKNKENKRITIIPGADIYLIFENDLMTDTETQVFWEKIYETYIFASELIISTNKDKTLDILQKMKEKVELNRYNLAQNNIFANLLEEIVL